MLIITDGNVMVSILLVVRADKDSTFSGIMPMILFTTVKYVNSITALTVILLIPIHMNMN